MRDDELYAFVGDARARISADERRRRRWLSRQLDDGRTFAAVCGHARDAGVEVHLDLIGGRVHRGRMVGAATEVLVVATDDGTTAYVAVTAVVALRTGGVPTGKDAAHWDLPGARTTVPAVDTPGSLADVFCDLADRGATADIGVIGGTRYRGRVSAAGQDVVTLADGRCLRLQMVTDVVATP